MLIGNLPLDAQENDLLDFFATVGEVREVRILKDNAGRGRGFAFVTMADQKQNNDVVSALNNAEFNGRILSVSLAKRDPHPRFNGFLSNLFRAG